MTGREVTVKLTELEWERIIKALGLMTSICCATKGPLADTTYQDWYNLQRRVRCSYGIQRRATT